MPLSVAMALSGIDRDQWGDFKELFDQGAQVVHLEAPRRSGSRGANSARSSRSSSPATSSQESGLGSSPDSEVSSSADIPITLRDFCLFKVAAMKGDGRKMQEIIEMFDTAGKGPEGAKDEEPEKENLKPEEEKQEQGRELEEKKDANPENRKEGKLKEKKELKPEENQKMEPFQENEVEQQFQPVRDFEVNWYGRNLLDLAANLKANAYMYVPAELPEGVSGYFQNRSQISRVKGAYIPPHQVNVCSTFACKFEESLF